MFRTIVVSQHHNPMDWSALMLKRMFEILGSNSMHTVAYEDRNSVGKDIFSKLDVKACNASALGLHAANHSPDDRVFFTDVQSMNIPAFCDGKRHLTGFIHGGPYEEHDLYSFRPKAYHRAFQASLECLDEIWVSTEAHKDLLGNTLRAHLRDRIVVAGLPVIDPTWQVVDPAWQTNEGDYKHGAIFVSRKSADKGYDLALEANKYLSIKLARYPDRASYAIGLGSSKVVAIPARKDTFGLVAAEAFLLGTLPAIPHLPCYHELYSSDYPGFIDRLTAGSLADAVSRLMELGEEEYRAHVRMGRLAVIAADTLFDKTVAERMGP